MRKLIAASAALLTLAACSSGAQKLRLPRPEVQIVQTSSVPMAAKDVEGTISVHYAVRVANKANETITLKRVSVQTIGEGAYHLGPTSSPFDVAIAPGAFEDVQFWVAGVTGRSVVGANGPVTVRVTCEFDSASADTFQSIATQVVNARTSITGEQ
jgi:hypothetical protein